MKFFSNFGKTSGHETSILVMKHNVEAVEMTDIRGKKLLYIVIGEGEEKLIINVGEKTYKNAMKLKGSDKELKEAVTKK